MTRASHILAMVLASALASATAWAASGESPRDITYRETPPAPAFQSLEQDPAGFLGAWFFWWGIVFVTLLFLAKRIAARLYAKALLRALHGGYIAHGELHDAERYYIRGALGMATAHQSRGLASTLGRVLWPLLLWFPMFALLYVQQFVNYLGVWGWLNHPLVLVPILSYAP